MSFFTDFSRTTFHYIASHHTTFHYKCHRITIYSLANGSELKSASSREYACPNPKANPQGSHCGCQRTKDYLLSRVRVPEPRG